MAGALLLAFSLILPVVLATEILEEEIKISIDDAGAFRAQAKLLLRDPAGRATLTLGPGFHFEEGRVLTVRLPGKPGEPARLKVVWSGQVPGTGVLLAPDAGWYPRGDESLCRYRLEAKLPKGWALAHQAEGAPVAGLQLAAGPWDTRRHPRSKRPIEIVYQPGREAHALGLLLGEMARQVDTFTSRIGPYPWERLTLVEAPGAEELLAPGLIGVSPAGFDRLLEHPQELGKALASQWWVQALHGAGRDKVWLEGIALFFADPRFSSRYSRESQLDTRRRVLYDFVEAGREGSTRQADAVERAALVFQVLEDEFGDAKVTQAFRELFAARVHQSFSWRDLDSALARSIGRPRLGKRFSQWVDMQDLPRLSLSRARRVSPTRLQLTIEAEREWILPLRVRNGEQAESSVELQGRRAKTSLPSLGAGNDEPVLDPEFRTPRSLDPREVPANLARMLDRPTQLVIVGATRGRRFERVARSLAGLIAGHSARVVHEAEVSAERLNSVERAWILGRPSKAFLRRTGLLLPHGLLLADDYLAFGGRVRRESSSALAIAMEHGTPGEGGIVLLDALSPSSLRLAWKQMDPKRSFGWMMVDAVAGTEYGHAPPLPPPHLVEVEPLERSH